MHSRKITLKLDAKLQKNAMESLRPIGNVVLPPNHAKSIKEIVTLIVTAQEILFVEKTIARLLDYQGALGLVMQIVAWVSFLEL